MDFSGISVTVDDFLDLDQVCILPVAKMFGKRLSAYDIRMQHNQIFVRLGQFISHLLFNSPTYKVSIVILNKKFDVLSTRIGYN